MAETLLKRTFSLDVGTVETLRRSAERLRKPQSQVLRLAIRDYADRIGRLGEEERTRLLRVFDETVPRIPARPVTAVAAEIAALRRGRRAGGRGRARRSPH